ncbi:MAG: hypothetical protein PUD51_09995 [Prevotellaceae bacterium]|nr:hypothetical protein [Prevotellaceae bacterium]
MGRIKSVMLWLLAVITLMSCAASKRVEQGSSEQRRDSVVTVVRDSVAKSEARVDSSAVMVKDEHHTSGTMTDKGSNEETITERVTESVDTNGNKTTTTDRTIHRKGDYERNATYEAQLKHQEEIISRMQHTIDSLALCNSLNVGTHLAKKDSSNVEKETNTKDVKPASTSKPISIFLFWAAAIGIGTWLYNKR